MLDAHREDTAPGAARGPLDAAAQCQQRQQWRRAGAAVVGHAEAKGPAAGRGEAGCGQPGRGEARRGQAGGRQRRVGADELVDAVEIDVWFPQLVEQQRHHSSP